MLYNRVQNIGKSPMITIAQTPRACKESEGAFILILHWLQWKEDLKYLNYKTNAVGIWIARVGISNVTVSKNNDLEPIINGQLLFS